MKPVDFEGTNIVLVASGCDSIPAMQGHGQIISTWELSPEEARRLYLGGHVRLSVLGGAHPPVKLWVE